jgi:hypothetical protein
MYRFIAAGEAKKQTLEAGDLAGIAEIYKWRTALKLRSNPLCMNPLALRAITSDESLVGFISKHLGVYFQGNRKGNVQGQMPKVQRRGIPRRSSPTEGLGAI